MEIAANSNASRASRKKVWRALNDPEVLRQCIPGCPALEQRGPERFKATVEIKIGPDRLRRFQPVRPSPISIRQQLQDRRRRQWRYGRFCKGSARVSLVADGRGHRTHLCGRRAGRRAARAARRADHRRHRESNSPPNSSAKFEEVVAGAPVSADKTRVGSRRGECDSSQLVRGAARPSDGMDPGARRSQRSPVISSAAAMAGSAPTGWGWRSACSS